MIPPAAMTGTRTASTTCGTRAMVPMSGVYRIHPGHLRFLRLGNRGHRADDEDPLRVQPLHIRRGRAHREAHDGDAGLQRDVDAFVHSAEPQG